ncbi:MAG TPA: sensor histidine kinase, partial [Flavobacterium sp.]
MNFNSNKLYRIPLRYHVFFWLTYFLFNTFRWGSYFNNYSYSLKTNLLGFPIHMTLCYLNI